jgi:hypothetical protein
MTVALSALALAATFAGLLGTTTQRSQRCVSRGVFSDGFTRRADTQSAATLCNNWGLAVFQLGQPLEAERAYRRSMEISSSGEQEQGVSAVVLINYSRILRDWRVFPKRLIMPNAATRRRSGRATREWSILLCRSAEAFTVGSGILLALPRCSPK